MSVDGEGVDDPNSIQGRIARLDSIFAMLQVLDSSDDVMLRRLETELMRLEASDLTQNTAELEREFDQRMQLPSMEAEASPDQASTRGLYDLLYSLSEMGAGAESERHEDADHDHEEHGGSLQQLLLPNGTPMTGAHINIVSHALANAREVLGLGDRARVDIVRDQGRRMSNASEPDREQREGEGEQIEGYEGDRSGHEEHDENRNEVDLSNQVADRRVSQIIETLRAFQANGTGADELDDFVLQAVLQLHAGPSTDNASLTPDHLGDEQMQLYQDCIAAIDDFFELLTMMNEDEDDHTDNEHRGTLSADDDNIEDDADDEHDQHGSRELSRGSI